MDNTYGFYNWNASGKINIKEHFQNYAQLITLSTESTSEDDDDVDENGSFIGKLRESLDPADFEELEEYCRFDNLTVEGELEKCEDPRPQRRKEVTENIELTNNYNLDTLKSVIQRKRALPHLPPYYLKYTSEIIIKYNEVQDDGPRAVPGKDVLVFIRTYEPFLHSTRIAPKTKTTKGKLNCTVVIRGSQTLAELRDVIKCVSDLSISKEISNNPKITRGKTAKEVYPSGFFYIEDTFYNDFRSPSSIDYSEVIREWGASRCLGPFKTASMENVTIESLTLRFGFPWVYQHQGSCEHLIVFSDARLLNRDDELAVSAYPRIYSLRPTSMRYCMMCAIFTARWVTTSHDRLPHQVCYFCDKCFKSYNYIGDEKIGNFNAYPYPFDPSL